ncbi:hypothetical protein GJ744_011639 [Endocarpon pusillum]|uniref:Potassium uptake protein n=1 Tax=Endocarpon pusillum TaxID=364733 RepID=A0A8H7AGJ5_9EURO|nr:hypothetical protein GJ744_011639 [Endocarpon pusillum]
MTEAAGVQCDADAIRRMSTTGGGVYARQRPASSRPPSISRGSTKSKGFDDDDDDDGKDGYVNDRDLKQKQTFKGWYLLWLAYQSTGVIYGDIGTSPLYVYSSTFVSDPTYDDLLGVLSLIIWTITLMVTVKYVLIVLNADDEGEGGTFALYSLLSRSANIIKRNPLEEATVKMERVLSADLPFASKSTRNFIERSRIVKFLLKVTGVFGVSLVMSDGILTPAQSVLGAIQGLKAVKQDITSATIVGVSCAILTLLFLMQPFGTTKIASSFAPIVIIWLLLNLAFGIYNLIVHDSSVLKAFSPYFAGWYLVRNKTDGWSSLGGILLAFTGVEALFADLGAFTRPAIQLSWLCFAWPCLLLAYIGQAAYISRNRDAWSNPFFNSVPPGMFYPSLVIAILAAIVASQAMITAVFQLLSQIMKLSYFPQIKLVHTSKIFRGQIYIPSANWLMMVGTIIVTAVYNNTTKLGHAYGFCVILVTFLTTTMVALVALIVWRLHLIVVITGYLVFAALDGLYLSSSATKIPDGAWFTLVLAFVLSSIFILWRFGKEQQWRAEASDRFPLGHMLTSRDETSKDLQSLCFTAPFGGSSISSINGIGIFFDKAGAQSTTPTVFIHFLQKLHTTCEVGIFFHLRPLPIPSVPIEERYSVTRCFISTPGEKKLPMQSWFRLVIRHGYTDVVVTRDLGVLVFDQIRNFIIREGAEKGGKNAASASTTEAAQRHNSIKPSFEQMHVSEKLANLQRAYESQVVYVVGKEQMRISEGTPLFRRIALNAFLWLRDNTRSKVQALNLAVDKLIEVGFVKEV